MPTNRNNNEAKELVIGTRIKYNSKLYEVIESVNCADCSIANICSNSNRERRAKAIRRRKGRL